MASSVTQTLPSPAARPPIAASTRIVAVTRRLCASIRETVLSWWFATQIDPFPYATAVGVFPTWITFVIRPVTESIRTIAPGIGC